MYQEQNLPNGQDVTKKLSTKVKNDPIRSTIDKVGRNLIVGYMVKLDRAKKSKAKSIRIKNNWKKKYYKLLDKHKHLKEVFEMYKHLP